NQFDPLHDNRFIDQQSKDHTTPGYPINGPSFPVVRISWREAMAYCEWLSKKTGGHFTLPTEAQWEWACRAGTDTPLSYGGVDGDFSTYANLADVSIKLLAVQGVNPQPIPNPSNIQAFLPRDDRYNDGQKILCEIGKYKPNAWGLYDMHGNAGEWTLSLYRPYPYSDGDGRNAVTAEGDHVARGGSWSDRPIRARSAFRLAYPSWQRVSNVGFRVMCDQPPVNPERVAMGK
ncbi:MAG: formylglycine-generating enzyme family protein, partial [Candidatus Sumerlaeota bacterium]|nr:formylglycine-generating enzyme family protein [Candidatus Sumerlaeota bacterium]